MNTKHPTALIVALALLAFIGLGSLALILVPGVPPLITYGSIVLGTISLGAAFGLWRLKRWGMILAIIASVLNALSAVPGIANAPNVLKVLSALNVVLSIVVIVVMALPSSRRAYAAECVSGTVVR